jgi:hypothetical protein
LPRFLDLTGWQQVEAFFDLFRQCIARLMEVLVIPKQVIQLLLEELVGHALIIFPANVKLGAQSIAQAASDLAQLLRGAGQEFLGLVKVYRVGLLGRQEIGLTL